MYSLIRHSTINSYIQYFMRYSSVCVPFPVLKDSLKASDLAITGAKGKSEEILKFHEKLTNICLDGGGEKGRLLHVKKNKKVLPRQRIQSVLDEDSDELELCVQAGLGLEYGDIPGASSICTIGKVQGRYCLINANDGTVKGGTFFPITVVKNLRAQQISLMNRLPSIYLVDSGGGFLPLQADLFPDKQHGGRAFYNQAVDRSNGIPQIALVCGSCTAGGAYVPMMCEDTAIAHRIGSIYLGGPPLVKAATGEDITSEDLGGATLHCNVSGCTDYFAETEGEGFEVLRDIVATLDIENLVRSPPEQPPLYDASELDGLCGLLSIDKERTLGVISRLVDGSRFREFKPTYGTNLIAGYTFIDGHRVGVLANCGPISYKDGLKGAHFIQICDQRNMSLLFLQNSGPIDEYWSLIDQLSVQEQTDTLRGRASMISCLSTAKIPKIVVNIGGCHGDDNYSMCGPAFEPNFLLCWPGAETSLHPPTTKNENKSPKKPASLFSFSSHSSWYAASRVLNDGIIKPSQTRKVVSQCLRIFDQMKRSGHKKIDASVMRF